MKPTLKRYFPLLAGIGLIIGVLIMSSSAQSAQDEDRFEHRFRVSSTTFENKTTLPISTIHNILINNTNTNECSIDGSPGGNQSPELSWTGAPPNTRTFVVIAYDLSAAFTHWGMYNISGNLTGLPENAGVAGSPYGKQIVNDNYQVVNGNFVAQYDGPCPPPNVPPDVHHYVFTVYALDIDLELRGSANFPVSAETLYQALINAGQHDHILASAKIAGLYSTTPPAH